MMSQAHMRQLPQAEQRPHGSWTQRYSVALFSAFCVVVAAAIGWWTGDWEIAVAGAVIMGPYALIAFIGGRTGRFRTLRGDHDEREQEQDYRAFVAAGNVILAVLLVLWVRELLDGNINSLPQWLLALFGASYGLTHVYYWWRDQRSA